MTTGVVLTIILALAFDYTNGFHDAANSVATVVSTRVLSPRHAVIWAAFFNFAAFLVFGEEVTKAIAKDVVDPVANILTVGVIFGGLVGAIGWNLLTFFLGLPTSSSHALVGGMAGAAVARGGFDVLLSEGLRKIGIFIILSPLIGMALGFLVSLAIQWIFHKNKDIPRLNRRFRVGQLVSAALFSLGHGANDAQKTMGIIFALLIASGQFAAETAATATLFAVSAAGIPVSTTHTITGAIVGVGTTKRMSAVSWTTASQVVWAWILTIPGAFAIGWVSSLIVEGLN